MKKQDVGALPNFMASLVNTNFQENRLRTSLISLAYFELYRNRIILFLKFSHSTLSYEIHAFWGVCMGKR